LQVNIPFIARPDSRRQGKMECIPLPDPSQRILKRISIIDRHTVAAGTLRNLARSGRLSPHVAAPSGIAIAAASTAA
jgi:hypothetical protein